MSNFFPGLNHTVRVTFKDVSFVMQFQTLDHMRMGLVTAQSAKPTEDLSITLTPVGHNIFIVAWQRENGTKVVHIHDYDQQTVHSYVTTPEQQFLQLHGSLLITD